MSISTEPAEELWAAAQRHRVFISWAFTLLLAAALALTFWPELFGVQELEGQDRWTSHPEAKALIAFSMLALVASMHGLWPAQRAKLRAGVVAASFGFTLSLSAMALVVSSLEWVDRFGGPTSLRAADYALWPPPQRFWANLALHGPHPAWFLVALAAAVLIGLIVHAPAARDYERTVTAWVPVQLAFQVTTVVVAAGVYIAIRVRAARHPLESAAYPALVGAGISLLVGLAGWVSSIHHAKPLGLAPPAEEAGRRTGIGGARTLTLAILLLLVVAAGVVPGELRRQMGLFRARVAIATQLANRMFDLRGLEQAEYEACCDKGRFGRAVEPRPVGELTQVLLPPASDPSWPRDALLDRADRLGGPHLHALWRTDAVDCCRSPEAPDCAVTRAKFHYVTGPEGRCEAQQPDGSPQAFLLRVDVRRSDVGDDRQDWSVLFDDSFSVGGDGQLVARPSPEWFAPPAQPILRKSTRAVFSAQPKGDLDGIARQFSAKPEEAIEDTFLAVENTISSSQLEIPGTGLSFRSSYATLAMAFVLLLLLASLRSHLARVESKPEPWIVIDGKEGVPAFAARIAVLAILVSPWVTGLGRIVTSAGDLYAQGSVSSVAADLWVIGVTLALMIAGIRTAMAVAAQLLHLRRSAR